MASWDAAFLYTAAVSAAAVVVLVAVAWWVLRAGPRKPPNQLFALFLLLVAGNAAADAARHFASWLAGTAEVPAVHLADTLGYAFLVLDPGILLYFALIYPRRAAVVDRWWFRPALVLTWAGFAAILAVDPAALTTWPHTSLPGQLLVLQVVGGYAAAYLVILHRLRTEDSETLRRQVVLLAGAFGIALLSRFAIVPQELGVSSPGAEERLVGVALVGAAFAAGAAWSLRGAAGPPRTALLQTHRLTGAGLAILAAVLLAGYLAPSPVLWAVTGTAYTSLRWVLFAAVGGYALLRYQVFDVEARARRTAEFVAGGLAVLALSAAALAASLAAAPLLAGVAPAQMLAAAGILAVAPGVARWAARQVRRHHAPEAPDGEARRVEMYRAALDASVRRSQLAPGAEPELAALRRDLGISEEQHRVLLHTARTRAEGPPDADGRLAGRYELGAPVGEGSSGQCHLATDVLLRRAVVVKQVAAVGGAREALQEARAAGRLNHPNIVTVHDIVLRPGTAYVVMEHVEGGSLRGLLIHGPPPPARARQVLDDLLAGLEAAHAADIVHGDVKPENVLLAGDGKAKLGDFGSARRGGGVGATLGQSLPARPGAGTLLYMAPEQVQGDPPSKAADLYAVAAVAWELLTGEHYLARHPQRDFELREAILRARPDLAGVALPPGWASWLERGLAKDPEARWPGAAAMRAALPPAAEPGGPPRLVSRARARWPGASP